LRKKWQPFQWLPVMAWATAVAEEVAEPGPEVAGRHLLKVRQLLLDRLARHRMALSFALTRRSH
jgi:hypothetical protein